MIYDKIKLLAKKRNIPIRKIEMECGFSQGCISKWNKHSPTAESVQKVAKCLRVPISDILGGN